MICGGEHVGLGVDKLALTIDSLIPDDMLMSLREAAERAAAHTHRLRPPQVVGF